MSVVRISQNDALMIEVLRKNGISDEALLAALKNGDVSSFVEIEKGNFDYTRLADLARERWDDVVQAVTDGYKITFNTRNGLKYLLNVKFGVVAETDFAVEEEAYHGLTLTREQLEWLRASLAGNWRVVDLDEEADGRQAIRIELYRGAQ
ncbi:hypothetical protein EDM56_29410 [Brevibacillus fluminis]|uniref:Uncharacterized protein n=1 Tax=Brevibacillus fluminis TaxID=511487 RepID=A0A3M8CXP0_9BACL|nr:hypothetical protein [Brevibacillus fluminis]RNB79635.1 hypothetical protein EDM56_29410 [Brevibacillus fluminis]